LLVECLPSAWCLLLLCVLVAVTLPYLLPLLQSSLSSAVVARRALTLPPEHVEAVVDTFGFKLLDELGKTSKKNVSGTVFFSLV
jgi:hypothetical protein